MILSHIVDFSIRRRGLILFFTMLLVILGVWSAFRVPLDAIPDITPTQVQVNTQISGLVPEDIEKLVTIPLEQELGGIPGLRESRSLSKYGLSQITLIFEEGADILRARQMVSERLQNRLGELPEGAQPRLAPITSGLGEIYYYVVDYKKGSKPSKQSRENQLMELKLLHDLRIKPLLRTVPGVAEVNDSGGYERQVIIAPDIKKMTQAGITFSELARVISENTANSGGGVIQLGGEQIGVMGAFRIENLPEIESIPIRFGAGARPLTVGDLASVRIGSSIRTGTATYNGRESVLGSVLMLTGGNSRVVAKEVGERLQEISKQLPSEVEIIPVYDRTDLIRKTIKTVGFNLFEGAMLVMAVLLLMLGDWRAALIVASAIPLSFLFAITGMAESKISANLMSLGAIDFGLIIDGAVVMVENIIRHLSDKQAELGRTLTAEERRREVSVSANEVARPTFIGVLIVTVVYIPILALTGIEGRMFKPMALTVMFALGGAMVLSLTLMPALCSFYLVGNIREKESRLVVAVRRFYEPLLDRAFKNRGWLVATSVFLFALSAWLFTRLGAEFIPRLDEGSYATHLIRTTSIGLDASLEMQKKSEEIILKEFPEVTYTFSRIGTSEIATDPMGVNVSDTYIFYKPKSEWPERESYGTLQPKEALASEMTRVLQQRVPGQSYLFSQPIEMRFNEILEGTRADISVKVFGDDYAELERLAGETRNILAEVRGSASVEFDSLGTAPLLTILPRRDELLKFNVHGRELNDAIHSGLAGMEAGDLIQGSRRHPILVRLPEEHRKSTEMIRSLPVRTEEGGILTLGQLTNIKVDERVNAITREHGQRRATIMVNLRGRDVESWVQEAQQQVISKVNLPDGYWIEFGGQFKNLQKARARLMVLVPIALTLIFALLYLGFKSLRQALLVMLCVPLAMTGGIFSLWIRGMPFTISAGIGFIALSGIAVLNGVMLVSFINQLRHQGHSLRKAVVRGTLTRLRPKIMTALVAALGFLPMALSTSAGAEVQRPLATVVIGGILSATFLTLIILPILYDWIEQKSLTKEMS